MGVTDNRKGPDSMQQEAQCADCPNATDDTCGCDGAGEEERVEAKEGEMSNENVDYPSTVTGVIRIMQAAGRQSAAEFMEEIHDTQLQAERLLKSLQKLHQRRTSQHRRVEKRRQPEKE